MPNESGTTAASDSKKLDKSEETLADDLSADGPAAGSPAGGPAWLAVPAVLWLAGMLLSVLASLRSPGVLATVETAIGLPAVISAALVGGAAVGLAATRLATRRRPDRSALRFAVALGAGLLTGIASAATVVVVPGRGSDSTVTLLGAVIAAGATLGGALAGVRAGAVVAAGVASSLGVFLLSFVRKLFNDELLTLLGAGESLASQWAAAQRLAWVGSTVDGLVAGLVAFAVLRWTTRRAAAPARGPAYLAAGGGAGVTLLLTEAITQVGGDRLIDLVRSLSEYDALLQDLATADRVTSGLVVFFVGALTAMIAFGRTLRPAPEHPAAD
jgi:hypothetical protein